MLPNFYGLYVLKLKFLFDECVFWAQFGPTIIDTFICKYTPLLCPLLSLEALENLTRGCFLVIFVFENEINEIIKISKTLKHFHDKTN